MTKPSFSTSQMNNHDDRQTIDAAEPAVWAVIPAAGVGRRMGSDTAKQYLSIADRTLLEHAALAVLACRRVRRLVIARHPDDRIIDELTLAVDSRVCLVEGGAERADSVLAALLSLEGMASDWDWVLVHDAARPCLPFDAVDSMLRELKDHPVGGILACAITDTVKRANSAMEIEQTLPRESLWGAQTPQVFRFGLLLRALRAAARDAVVATDEAMAVESLGFRPLLLPGPASNIKVTFPQDLHLAAWYLEQGKPCE